MKFTQLPNGDLWTGRKLDTERPDTLSMEGGEAPEDVVAQMITAQRGETLSCVFCGQSFSRKQLNELSEHVEKQHPSSVKPPTNAEVAMFDLSQVEIGAKVESKPIGK